MRAVKGGKTSLEQRVRAELARRGVRGWCMNDKEVPGKPDFAFTASKVAVFVNGCFWHGCRKCRRPMPVANKEYWAEKIARNVRRDARIRAKLRRRGWTVVSIWEHEIRTKPGLAAAVGSVQSAVTRRVADE